MAAWSGHVADVLKFVVQIGLVAYIFMVLMIYQMSRERTIRKLDQLNAALENSKAEVEAQREALAESNVHIANINANLERLVESRTAKLQEAKKELDTFLYEAAHALRRPVARIMGLVSILRDQPENSPTSATMHAHVDTSTQLMDQILHKLIMVSELDLRPVTAAPVQMAELVGAVVEERKEGLAFDGEITVNVAAALQVVADRFLLEIALGYVVDNAIQYSARLDRQAVITVSALEDEKEMVLRVEDNGLGIPASEIGRVTEMFFRATEKVPGGGLGLYVVQRAMERLEGSLSLESELGVRTVVELRVPLM